MAEILIIVDGMEDLKYYELGNKTPFEYSLGENISKMKFFKYFNSTPKGFKTDSLCCILNILGVDKNFIPKGRAYLEANANDIKVNENDLALRCNNVLVDEKGILIGSNNESLKIDNNYDDIEIYNINQYRNIVVVKDGKKYFNSLITYPPHQNIGKSFLSLMPKGNELAFRLKNLSKQCIMWSPSIKTNIPLFYKLHNKKASVVCHTDIVKGIADEMGMYCPKVNGATGDIDTDLISKSDTAVKLSFNYDFVMLHINGADEASHRKNLWEKVEFIKKIDIMLGYIFKSCKKGTEIILMSDHATLCSNGSHDDMKVKVFKYII